MRRATHKRPSRGGGAADAGAILRLDSDDVCGKNGAMFTNHDWEWFIYTTYKKHGDDWGMVYHKWW